MARITFTPELVREIREVAASGVANRELAPRYGVHEVTISRVVRGLIQPEAGGPVRTEGRLGPDATEEDIRATVVRRLLAHREISESGCWFWTRPVDAYGYGVLRILDRVQGVHRWAYEAFVGRSPRTW